MNCEFSKEELETMRCILSQKLHHMTEATYQENHEYYNEMERLMLKVIQFMGLSK